MMFINPVGATPTFPTPRSCSEISVRGRVTIVIDLVLYFTKGNMEKGRIESLIEIYQLNDDVI
jgi:hypothetical protein